MAEVDTALGTELRELDELAQCQACVRLQRTTWGEDFDGCVPASILMIARKSGGILAGAVDPGDRLLGFVFGIAAVEDGRPYHWSHMLAVRPEAQGRGLGRGLKLFQRKLLLDRGIATAVWTFDPLVSRNAHLNLNRLGVRVARYVDNMYGNMGSSLHGRLDTDRFLVRWELESPRVRRAIGAAADGRRAGGGGGGARDGSGGVGQPGGDGPGGRGGGTAHASRPPRFEEFGERACALRVGENGGIVTRDLVFRASPVLIQIPSDFGALLESDPERLRLWRRRSRDAFHRYLEAGYEVDALCRRRDPDRWYYLLRPAP